MDEYPRGVFALFDFFDKVFPGDYFDVWIPSDYFLKFAVVDLGVVDFWVDVHPILSFMGECSVVPVFGKVEQQSHQLPTVVALQNPVFVHIFIFCNC